MDCGYLSAGWTGSGLVPAHVPAWRLRAGLEHELDAVPNWVCKHVDPPEQRHLLCRLLCIGGGAKYVSGR